jgi:hypothetical protein
VVVMIENGCSCVVVRDDDDDDDIVFGDLSRFDM